MAVLPPDHDWAPAVAAAASRAGAEVVGPQDAQALLWVGSARERDQLQAALHDGIAWVQLRSAGVDGFIRDGIVDQDRTWTCARGSYGPIVAEHALGLLLAAARRLPDHAAATRWGSVPKPSITTLGGSRVVVVGAGGIGAELVRTTAYLGARPTAVTRDGRPVAHAEHSVPIAALHQVLPGADHVVLALPLTPDTHRVFGADELALVSPHAWIVNVGRGETLDTDALVTALRNGSIAGAALDVTDPEPLPADHPLWTMPNVLITSHTANPDGPQREAFCGRIEENVGHWIAGRPMTGVVDVLRGY